MSTWKQITGWALGLAAVVLFGLLVWPTLYRYDHMNLGIGTSLLVRINRINGDTDLLSPSGWVRKYQERQLTPAELQSLVARFELDGQRLHVDLYNGTDAAVKGITVEITLEDWDRKTTLQRLYQIPCDASPHGSTSLNQDLGPDVKPNFDPAPEAKRKWPGLRDFPDEKLIGNLQDPKYFRATFPEYRTLSDQYIHSVTSQYLVGGRRFGYKPWSCKIVAAKGTPQ